MMASRKRQADYWGIGCVEICVLSRSSADEVIIIVLKDAKR